MSRGNVDEITADQWLKEQFEYELCDECGGDASDHVAIPLGLGDYGTNWFAWCKYPPYFTDDSDDLLHLASDVRTRKIVGVDDQGNMFDDPRSGSNKRPQFPPTSTEPTITN